METQEQKEAVATALAPNTRLHGALLLVFILLAAFLFAQTIQSLKEYRYVGSGIAPTNTISVSGEGEVFSVPDRAEFTFSIIEEAATVSEVQDAATEKANAAIDALKGRGVEEKDIKTVSYNLYPKYEYKPVTCVRYPCDRERIQNGFSLNQSVRVRVTNLDTAGELVQLVTDSGVQSVSGLSFTIDDEDSVMEEARKAAIEEAKEKAQRLASDLGVTLSRIVSFHEGTGSRVAFKYATAEMAMDDAGVGGAMEALTPALPVGENRVVSNVTIVYEIR